ncbi:MAG: superoxide dismutase [Pirellulales bacterium]
MQHDRPHDSSVNRRQFVQSTVATLAVGGAIAQITAVPRVAAAAGTAVELPKLPYAYDALEPYIDTKTMTIHHTKHHQAYIDRFAAVLTSDPELAKKTPEQLLSDLASVPEKARSIVQNHGGGHLNHCLFWEIMGPGKGGEPKGKLADAIKSKFNSFANFKEAFTTAAMTRFGSGWAWLAVGKDGLEVLSTANQDSPLSLGKTPILGLDVWEHAYYLHYQNRRAEYVTAWWNIVNWEAVSKKFESA